MVEHWSEGDLKDLEGVIIDRVKQAVDRLKIGPRNLLRSLVYLQIENARIMLLESEAATRGGTADVQPAILAPTEPTNILEFDDREYVAVKKMRFDMETDDDRVLVVSIHSGQVVSNGGSNNRASEFLKGTRL
ncbi:hypothetical protein FS837_007013 [Tulasnella sp. UAMH 9824]|nr:hypothetical protein FS837_007013 [Tulasnella sp. UAMH 9824]